MLIALFLTAFALIATLAMWLSPRTWVVDLAVHFRLQFAACAVAAAVLFTATAHLAWAAVALVPAVTNIAIAVAVLRGSSRDAAAAGESPVIRLASINVYYRNFKYQRVIDLLQRERADAVVLVEVTAAWEAALAAVRAQYPYWHVTRGRKGTGVMLLSRLPFAAVAELPGYSEVEPAIIATLQVQEQSLQILGVHTSWPLGRRSSMLRDQQLERLAQFARSVTAPLVILGDLNVSPFSARFQDMLVAGELRSAADGHGWQPTWPTFLPAAGIHIDHGLTRGAVTVRSFRRGPSVGSDHLPIIIECSL